VTLHLNCSCTGRYSAVPASGFMTKLMQLPLAVVLTFGLGGFGSTPPLKLPHFCKRRQTPRGRSAPKVKPRRRGTSGAKLAWQSSRGDVLLPSQTPNWRFG
jgi:hypothetical protein